MQFSRSDYISISQPVAIQAAKEVVTLVWQKQQDVHREVSNRE